MHLGFQDTKFQLVSKIKIPGVFYRRFKTGIESFDRLLGDGFLPGSTFTLAAAPGSGKTTLMLQVLSALASNTNKKVAYASGEESAEQLAFSCKRMNINDIKVANRIDVDTLVTDIREMKLDFLVLDSFQCLRSSAHGVIASERYIINQLCTIAKETECVIGIIMHITKTGKLKGNSLVPHAVDMNVFMAQGDPEIYGDTNAREITIQKHRFGPTMEAVFYMQSNGFDFETMVNRVIDLPGVAKEKMPTKKSVEINKLLAQLDNGPLILKDVIDVTGNFHRAKNLLKELEATQVLQKEGRGDQATWSRVT